MIRVLIADDHPIVREGLRRIVEGDPELKVVGEAADGNQTIALVERVLADVLLLDIGMPGPGVFDLMSEVAERRTRLPILILSVYPEEQYAIRLLKLGAAGYLTKDHSPEELVTAIRRVADGRRYVSSNLAEMLANALGTDPDRPPHEALSDREFQVLVRFASGSTVTQIARSMGLSPKTISTYRSRLITKLGVGTNADIIRYALDHELVQ